ncbi:MAG: PEP-CTERM sorting domain-containing protein [Verrucomicrobiaceae bacterium]|nr:MAG: PEP-CTERM sorting domain-containing protein [Verrucomicrobiaceae bacterium]
MSSSKGILLAGVSLLAGSLPAAAHLSYSGRDFGIFSGLEMQSNSIAGQTTVSWAWADGTDADFMHTHRIKFFRFTLENSATVTISVASLSPDLLLPGFSLYSGLAHSSPADYETDLTFQYLATLPGPTKEGAFNALGTWKMGNDNSQTYNDFSTFTYVGNAADGTSANFGSATGINGDGVADGFVSSSFNLPAGSYTLAVSGANYAGQGAGAAALEGANQGADLTTYGMTVGVTVVPEPTAGIMVAAGVFLLGMRRRHGCAVR